MSNTAENTTNATNEMEQILALQELDLATLQARAAELGVDINETMEQAEIIDAVVAKMTEAPDSEVETEVEHGHLFSIHSRTDEAKRVVKAARNRILANREAGVWFNLFLQNQEGDSYNRRVPGVRCTLKNIDKVLDIVTLLPDGSQDALFQEFKDNPQSFKDPLLVFMRRRNKDDSYTNYVMLYLQRKQENLVEQTF